MAVAGLAGMWPFILRGASDEGDAALKALSKEIGTRLTRETKEILAFSKKFGQWTKVPEMTKCVVAFEKNVPNWNTRCSLSKHSEVAQSPLELDVVIRVSDQGEQLE
jgi:hypothetical protein